MTREFPSRPVVGVGAVVLRGGRDHIPLEVLLVRRANPPSQGEWSLPGGAVELGERLEAAVVREVREETGLTVEPVALVEVLDYIVPGAEQDPGVSASPVRFHYILIDYVCHMKAGTLAPASDAADAAWRPVEQLDDLRPSAAAVIRKAVAHRALD